MVDYGIKVSKDGHDVKTADDKDLVLTSKGNSLKILSKGSTVITLSSNYNPDLYGNNLKTIAHGLDYTPAFLAFCELSTTSGRYYAHNITGVPSETDYHHWWCYSDSTNLNFVVGKNTSSTHWNTACQHTIYYYIFVDPSI